MYNIGQSIDFGLDLFDAVGVFGCYVNIVNESLLILILWMKGFVYGLIIIIVIGEFVIVELSEYLLKLLISHISLILVFLNNPLIPSSNPHNLALQHLNPPFQFLTLFLIIL